MEDGGWGMERWDWGEGGGGIFLRFRDPRALSEIEAKNDIQ
jgi:hypothetical protein